MPGIGSENPGAVSAGLAAQPLVTPATQVVNPSSVQALSDAFRQGVLTVDDIMNRLGPVGQAKRKAELAGFTEFTSPDATAARAAGYKAAAARASLETAQAGAAEPLVAPSAELAGSKLDREKADLKWAGGVSAYQQYAPYFGQPAILQTDEGKPDFDAMGAKGNEYTRTMAQQNFARMMLEPDPARKITGVNEQQQPFERQYNKWGVEVTPGSPTYKNLTGIIQDTNSKIFGAPGSVNVQPTPAAPPTAPPVINPGVNGDAARAAVMNANPDVAGSQVANLSDDQARLLAAVAPATATAVPVPTERPMVQPGSYSPGTGLVTGPSKNLFTADKIGEDLRKQKSYELWDQQKGFAQSFETTADRINAIPVSEQRAGKTKMNTLDIALAESIIKMYDPGMAIREFKWDKLAEAQPYLEKLPNWRAEFLRTGSLTPEGRQRLIEMGYDNISGKEAAVLPHVQFAAKRAQDSGLKPSDVLNADEVRVLNKQVFGKPPGSPGASHAAPAGKTVTIPGLGTGIFDAKSGIFTRTQ